MGFLRILMLGMHGTHSMLRSRFQDRLDGVSERQWLVFG